MGKRDGEMHRGQLDGEVSGFPLRHSHFVSKGSEYVGQQLLVSTMEERERVSSNSNGV
jgi:hypothetical protein